MLTPADIIRAHAMGAVIEPDAPGMTLSEQLAISRASNAVLAGERARLTLELVAARRWRDVFALLAAVGAVFALVRTLAGMF